MSAPESSPEKEPRPFVLAAVQMDVEIARPAANLRRIEDAIRAAAARGAGMAVFPECAIPGYCFESAAEAMPHAEPIPGPSTLRLAEVCREAGILAVVGLLEKDGDALHNACALIGPAGVIGSYRKVHLPHLGVDRFTAPGNRPFQVFDAGPARVGMLICYDGSFPEAARVLGLGGADLVALPTNWPPGSELTAEFVMNTRALENHIYFAAVNRVGTERGFRFIGQSRICHPTGATLALSAGAGEEVLYAEVDPRIARDKRLVRVPGKHVIDRFRDRRPEMYGRITESGPAGRPAS